MILKSVGIYSYKSKRITIIIKKCTLFHLARFILLSILATITIPSSVAGKEVNKVDTVYTKAYFYEPYPLQCGASVLQIGGSFTLLPLPVVEDEYPIPALDIQYKLGIWDDISFVGSFSTNVFSNLIHAGLQWNSHSGRFSYGFGSHIGSFLGFISSEGQFDNNTAYAIFFMPIARFGYRFNDFSVSTSFVMAYIIHGASKVSDLKAVGIDDVWNDFFCTLAIEQPFLKKSHLSFGFSLAFARSPYQSWLLFNTIDQYLFVPEFFIALHL